MSVASTRAVDEARVRAGLESAGEELDALGLPVPPLRGKLLRPLLAWAHVPPACRDRVDTRFWSGALAVQMAHEASLLHDDIVDGAETRRGEPTLWVRQGVGPALVRGDHLLTAAYRAASATGCPAFLALFAEAVERTVAGEVAQGLRRGHRLQPGEYDAMVAGKSGQLFGVVAALWPCLEGAGPPALRRARDRGVALGSVYQRVDDFLDYCPPADPGKPTFQDYVQGKWTWVLDELPGAGLGLPLDELRAVLHGRDGGGRSPLARALERLERDVGRLVEDHAGAVPGDAVLPSLLGGWMEVAREALRSGAADGVGAAARGSDGERLAARVRARADALGGPEEWTGYFARHSRTFRFASRLFPAPALERVAGIYAFCRFTDDLVDEPDPALPPGQREALLDVWVDLARKAYGGERVDLPLLDRVVGDMAGDGVPFHYVAELIEGVRSDLGRVRVADVAELDRYCYRVASVVGGWVTCAFGVRDPTVLERAYRLGHAMQLTNIVRDVGEDWRRDRLYLPADLMAAHGVDEVMVRAVAERGGPAPAAWRSLMEDLMERADRAYDDALRAVPALPRWYQRPVVVAARVYQGIHRKVRRNAFDNGTRRAYTSGFDKLLIGGGALLELRRLRREAREQGARSVLAGGQTTGALADAGWDAAR